MPEQYIMFPQIDPVIFSIGPVSVRWYGLMYVIAFVLANWLANRQADKAGSGWTRDQVSDLMFYGFLGVILGGRVGYVLFYNFGAFIADPLYLFRTWEGGMSFHGGVLGVLAAMAWFAKRNQKKFLELGDFVVPLLPLGLAFGRLGNFINGELWGRTTDVSWGMLFPNAGMLPRHPSQLYELLGEGILLFILLQWYKRKSPPAGNVGGLFLLGYGVARFVVEFFREPDAQLGLLSLGMSMGQWLCVPMILAGSALIVWGYQREARVRAKA
ncbi:prolipoprotein diacylglyceryl transferase [Rheinheimera sp.]|uniref:prolipoprotein diacylglyceryl transferase n=1 Tax=Rheinheimera sp. TaxID=1869214 RepID=UPI003AF48A55